MYKAAEFITGSSFGQDVKYHKCLYDQVRSEEHTSELQSRETISYAVFCLKKKNKNLCEIYDISLL